MKNKEIKKTTHTKQNTLKIMLLLGIFIFVGAACQKSSDAGVYKSEDGGNTWAKKVFVGQEKKKVLTISGVDVEKLVFDPENSSIIYLASKANGLYKTENAGDQWRALNTNGGRIIDMAIDPQSPNILYALKGSNILKSTDSGEKWEVVYTDNQQALVSRILIDTSNTKRLYAGTSIGTVLLSEDEGETWQVIYRVDEPVVGLIMHPSDNRIMYMLELDAALHKSVDGGKTWVNLFDNEAFKDFVKLNKSKGGIEQVKQLTMDPNNPNVLYILTEAGIMKSTNGGESWEFIKTLIEFGVPQNAQMDNLTIDPTDSNVILFSIGHFIHKTTDGGNTWHTIETFPSAGKISVLTMDPTNSNILYAGVVKVQTKKKSLLTPATK